MWIQYNANPDGNRTEDCTIRAICKLTGKSWEENIQFHGNLTNVTGTITLGIYLDGELLPETEMNVVAAAPANVLSVDAATEIAVDGCVSNISVRNIAGTDLIVETANIIIRKEVA